MFASYKPLINGLSVYATQSISCQWVKKYFMEDVLPNRGCHDAAFSITVAAAIVVIHTQVMPHLMRHNSGDIRQAVVTEL